MISIILLINNMTYNNLSEDLPTQEVCMKWSNLFLSLSIFLLVSCQGGESGGKGKSMNDSFLKASISTELTEQEKDDLLFMWEEEKMARDIYSLMNQKYQAKVFQNIGASEKKHMDSVKNLLTQVGLSTPVDENQIGLFTNPIIIDMYTDLLYRGNQSYQEALQVGLDIEVTDIADLTLRIQNARDPGIIKVYEALRDASYNHKAAFERQLGM